MHRCQLSAKQCVRRGGRLGGVTVPCKLLHRARCMCPREATCTLRCGRWASRQTTTTLTARSRCRCTTKPISTIGCQCESRAAVVRFTLLDTRGSPAGRHHAPTNGELHVGGTQRVAHGVTAPMKQSCIVHNLQLQGVVAHELRNSV